MLQSQRNSTHLSAKCLPSNPARSTRYGSEEDLGQAMRQESRRGGGQISGTDAKIMAVMKDGRWRTAGDISNAVDGMSYRAVVFSAQRLARLGKLASEFQDGVSTYVASEGYAPSIPQSTSPMQRRLFSNMKDDRGYTARELTDITGMSRDTVSNLLQRMRRQGFVESRPLPDNPMHFEWRKVGGATRAKGAAA